MIVCHLAGWLAACSHWLALLGLSPGPPQASLRWHASVGMVPQAPSGGAPPHQVGPTKSLVGPGPWQGLTWPWHLDPTLSTYTCHAALQAVPEDKRSVPQWATPSGDLEGSLASLLQWCCVQ